MKSLRILRLVFVLASLALFSCGQTVEPRWTPPPGMSYSTLHGIWRGRCVFDIVQPLHGSLPGSNPRGNLYVNTWVRIEQIGATDFRFGIGGMPGEGEAGGVFWLNLSAGNGSISGSEQLVFDNSSNRVTFVSATGTHTVRTLNLVFFWQIETHAFDSAYIERATCTATRDHDW